MGFLCKIEKEKYLDKSLDRDLGLSNIYNINTNTNFCFETFKGPTYFLSGATKPLTGTTAPCSGTPTNCYAVYNLSEVDNINLTFNFTGSTDYTGYTGNFCYKIFDRNYFDLETQNITKLLKTNSLIPDENVAYQECFNFSAITSSTISSDISIGELPKANTDYMLRSYYEFTGKDCLNKKINTWESSIQYQSFDFNQDWYFITVTNPDKPQINPLQQKIIDSVEIKQETPPAFLFQDAYQLNNIPLNFKVNLYINGILLTDGVDYLVDTSQFPKTNPIIKLISGTVSERDIINIIYLIGPQSSLTVEGNAKNDLFEIESFLVTGFTESITASTTNIVNQNPTKGTQEVFLKYEFDPESNIVASINGTALIEDVEYYKSSTTPNKLIMNPHFTTIKKNDILSFWYFKIRLDEDNNLGTLDKNSIPLQWQVNPLSGNRNYTSGFFTLEVTETSDTDWVSLFLSKKIDYNFNEIVYTYDVTDLEVNKDYKFRVIYNKIYKNILKEEIITSSEVVGYFNTKNDKVIYGY